MFSSASNFGSEPGPLLLRCSGGTGGILDIGLSSLSRTGINEPSRWTFLACCAKPWLAWNASVEHHLNLFGSIQGGSIGQQAREHIFQSGFEDRWHFEATGRGDQAAEPAQCRADSRDHSRRRRNRT